MAASKQEVLRTQMAWVQTESGRELVKLGESLPDDVLPEEAEHLRGLGALGAPVAPASADAGGGDEVDALSAALTDEGITDYVREAPVKEIVAAVGDDAELATRVLNAESDATQGEPRKSLAEALQKVIDSASTGE